MTICGLINSHVIFKKKVGKVLKLCIYPSTRQTENKCTNNIIVNVNYRE